MRRALLLLPLAALSAWAQLQVSYVRGTDQTPVGGSGIDLGAMAVGDTLAAKFRVSNTGNAAARAQQPIVGAPFTLSAPFATTPYTLAPGATVDFTIGLVPKDAQEYSAIVTVSWCQQPSDGCPRGTLSFSVKVTAVQAVTVIGPNSSVPLAAGDTVNFGSVLSNNSVSKTFTLVNSGAADVTVDSVMVSDGTTFQGPTGFTVTLSPQQSTTFQVTFAPKDGQAAQGTLTIGQGSLTRSFKLTGQGLNPPLPAASIALASTAGASAQQNSLSIPLASASQVSGTGTLTLEFQPSLTGVADDPAIRFVSGGKRTAAVTVSPGDSSAKFNGQPSISFQTGTTAGTIVFTLKLGTQTQQVSLTIAGAPVSFDLASSVRKFGELDVSLAGFDNTYSASQLTFTFYDAKGAAVAPGAIHVDVTADFKQYFASTTDGGMFALLAKFLVNGDTSQVVSVDAQITTSAGTTTAQNIAISY